MNATRVIMRGWLAGAVLAGCGPQPGQGTDSAGSSMSTSSSSTGSGTEAPGTTGTTTGETTSTSTTAAPPTTTAGETDVSTSGTSGAMDFISSPDLGPPEPCACAPDELCMFEIGIDSWFKICVTPPEGCDPADHCSAACAQACVNPTPLPDGCDRPEPPEALTCVDGSSQCSAWAQNCPDGEKCVLGEFWGDDHWELECVPVAAPAAQIGEPCAPAEGSPTGGDSCVKGALCLPVGAMQANVCVPHCEGSPQAPICPQGLVCATTKGGAVTACVPACDPLLQDCPEGQICTLGLDDFACMPDDSGDQGQIFDGCLLTDECDPGFHCIDDFFTPNCGSAGQCCTPYCDLQAPVCPPMAPDCVSLFTVIEADEALPQWQHLGVCTSPE